MTVTLFSSHNFPDGSSAFGGCIFSFGIPFKYTFTSTDTSLSAYYSLINASN